MLNMNFVNCDKIGHYKDKYRYNCRSKKLYEPLMVITNIDYDFGNRDNRNMNFYCNTEYEKMDKNYKYNCDPIKVITNEEYDFENNAINYGPENRYFLDEYKKRKRKIIEQGYESDDDGAVYNATCSTKYNDEDEDDEDERKKPKNSFKSKTKTKKSKTKKSKTKKSKYKTKKSKTKKSKTKKKSLNK